MENCNIFEARDSGPLRETFTLNLSRDQYYWIAHQPTSKKQSNHNEILSGFGSIDQLEPSAKVSKIDVSGMYEIQEQLGFQPLERDIKFSFLLN